MRPFNSVSRVGTETITHKLKLRCTFETGSLCVICIYFYLYYFSNRETWFENLALIFSTSSIWICNDLLFEDKIDLLWKGLVSLLVQ